ncbi:TetR/AcrR family transcriptional regulator [Pelagicoccus mobilis]|uniref:TetR/AcrR family transcriptional regulator n=1 Tax=Pelagicoccus mobilis TaxID=415221 RepID=A0A934S471_9BACT|nr:TetR/AcrR family transcriptional regulator [Pelagicoccus mobilis]MBK1880411.1 TetR/AcrR family transcriptional regulator [Pelagicoccus mobilis]
MTEKTNRKCQIIEVASKLFFEQGYHATGIKQIIEAADIAKGTFYSHFKSKEELGLEWLECGNRKWKTCRDSFLEQFATPKEKLIALFDYQAKGAEECSYRGCAMLNMLAETPELGCPMRKAIRGYKKGYLCFIRELVNQHLPDASDDDREQRAGAIYLLSEGATVAAQSFCKTGPIDIAKVQVEKILAE